MSGVEWFWDVSRLSTFIVAISIIVYASFRSLKQSVTSSAAFGCQNFCICHLCSTNESSQKFQITTSNLQPPDVVVGRSKYEKLHLKDDETHFKCLKPPISLKLLSPRQTLDSTQAILLPIGASLTLIVMFYFFDSVQLAITITTAFVSWISFAILIIPLCCAIIYILSQTFFQYQKYSPFNKTQISQFLAFAISFCLIVFWVKTDHWLLMDALGIGLCVSFITFVQLPSLKVSSLLLVGLLVYDVFWVFFSAYIFRSNVMLHVATHTADNPLFLFFGGNLSRVNRNREVMLFQQGKRELDHFDEASVVSSDSSSLSLSINSLKLAKNLKNVAFGKDLEDDTNQRQRLSSSFFHEIIEPGEESKVLGKIYQKRHSLIYNVKLRQNKMDLKSPKMESINIIHDRVFYVGAQNLYSRENRELKDLQTSGNYVKSHATPGRSGDLEGILPKPQIPTLNVNSAAFNRRHSFFSDSEDYTQTLSLPVKLLFPSSANSGHFSMLGLGDIVMPGLLICFLLRYDYLKMGKKIMITRGDTIAKRYNTSSNSFSSRTDRFKCKKMIRRSLSTCEKLHDFETVPTSPKVQYYTVLKDNLDNLTNNCHRPLNLSSYPTHDDRTCNSNYSSTVPLMKFKAHKNISTPASTTSNFSNFAARLFRFLMRSLPSKFYNNHPYFITSIVGYLLGLITATLSSEIFKSPQPALMYLVPFTLFPITLLARYKGDLPGMWEQPFDL